MPRTIKDGPASITIDDDRLIAALDKTANGAPSLVIRESKRELGPVMAAAVSRWPVRYRRSRNSRGSFRLFDVVEGSKLKVGIENTATTFKGRGYAWFIRYSYRDRDSLQREIKQVQRIARDAENYADDVESPGVRRFVFLKRARELAEREALNLPPLGRTSTAQGLVRVYTSNLFNSHGTGAPQRVLAGRSIWSAMIRRPGRKVAAEVVDRLQDEITALARGQ